MDIRFHHEKMYDCVLRVVFVWSNNILQFLFVVREARNICIILAYNLKKITLRAVMSPRIICSKQANGAVALKRT